MTHSGTWRTLLYKESKATGQCLVSIAISDHSLTESQQSEFEKALVDLLSLNLDNCVSVSIIKSSALNGAYDHTDAIKYLTEQKTYTEEFNGYKFLVSPQAFFQVNTHVFCKMLDTIKTWAELSDEPGKQNAVLLDV